MKDNVDKLEDVPDIGEEDWADESNETLLVQQANNSVCLLDYLETKLNGLSYVSSSAGWTRRTYCPFHKNGAERTASFFINPTKNIFYCQACGIKGGIVQFISFKFNRPPALVAKHIISINGPKSNVIEEKNKLAKKRKIIKTMEVISDMFRTFIHANSDDPDAMKYIDKIMEGFDLALSMDRLKIEDNIDEILSNFKLYLSKYN